MVNWNVVVVLLQVSEFVSIQTRLVLKKPSAVWQKSCFLNGYLEGALCFYI